MNKGQSIIELLISLAFGVTVMLTAFALLRFLIRLAAYDPVAQTATFALREEAYSAASAADGSWASVASAVSGASYHAATSTGGFSVVPGAATSTVNGIVYGTSFSVDSVWRDAADAPFASGTPGTADDPSTKKITTTVTWAYQGVPYADTVEQYVARTKNEAITQTDWSGGPTDPSDPAVGPGASPSQFYQDSSSTLDWSGTPGSLVIQGY